MITRVYGFAFLGFAFLSLLFTSSCSKPSGSGLAQHATLEMRDGTEVSGTILSTSTSEVQLTGDDKALHTIPMTQVRSIEYDEAPPVSVAVPPVAPPQPGAAAPPPSPLPPVAPPPQLKHRDHYHPVESAITTTTYELAPGTEISVRNEETIDSGKAVEGQTFPAEVTADARDASGNVVIPRGSNAQIVIRSASKGGKIKGASDLVMDLASVSIDGREYLVSTVDLAERGRSGFGANRRTGEFTGGGAAVGAIIGAIAGGGKGAAIGAGSGAGAGAITQILTKGHIKVPVETVLTFKLDRTLRVRAASTR
jgi:hypothetical protein